KPYVIGCEGALEVFHLLTDGNWAALQVMVSPDRLRAPCTAERAAPGGGQVETEIAVRGQPSAAITVHVNEIPSGALGELDLGHKLRAVDTGHPRTGKRRSPGDAVHQSAARGFWGEIEPSQDLEQCGQPLALEGDVCARSQIRLGSVAHIGAGYDDARSRGASGGDHLARRLAHLGEAHLAQKIEVVLV